MKKVLLGIAALLFLLASGAVQAQGVATTIQFLRIEILPDYDQPAALFLLTGELPAGTPLPTTVVVPLPETAELNAVARITTANQLIDDIPFSEGDGELTFTTPDLGFRVEYYLPFAESGGSTRQFSFLWQSSTEIAQLLIDVQQPAAATNFSVTPPAVNVSVSENDGLTYHTLPTTAVPANQAIALDVTYETTGALTFEEPTPVQAESSTNSWLYVNGINIPFVLAGLGAIFLVAYGLLNRTSSSSPKGKVKRKKRGNRAATSTGRYCTNCGKPLKESHKFCRHCGTAVKL